MSWLKRRIKVSADVFLQRTIQRTFEEGPEHIQQLLRTVAADVTREDEILFFASMLPLIAMVAARCPAQLQQSYLARCDEECRQRIPTLDRWAFQTRATEYMRAFAIDSGPEGSHYLPRTMDLVLTRVCGAADAGLGSARAVLLTFVLGQLNAHVSFLRDLKIR